MSKIVDVLAREVFDSRADITLEVEIHLESGVTAKAIIPSGTSMGKYEAVEVRDNDMARFAGKGVLNAIHNIREVIRPQLLGMSVFEQLKIDHMLIALDGTSNKRRLGANAILGISLAVAKAAAEERHEELCDYLNEDQQPLSIPTPIFSMLSGGRHGIGNCDFQDFQIIILKTQNLMDSMRIGKEIYQALKSILMNNSVAIGVSGTGGLMPTLTRNEQGLTLLIQAIKAAGYAPGIDVGLSMDLAAEMFYEKGRYNLFADKLSLTTDEFINYLVALCDKYPIVLMEDPLGEDDHAGWQKLTQRIGNKIELVGDDLFTTNIERFNQGFSQHIANSILVKPNQIGTLSETTQIIKHAMKSGYGVVVSRRSGETEDTFIADLAVAFHCPKVKFGSFARTESLAKYNRLIRLKEIIDNRKIKNRQEISFS
ncbi:phosphopyruvate hydratase [Celerinatantimonas sp. YJH-8]|uniref:phosphopyruvate hydratase n=1 Tax=Celerinatantimonas sp. YJH-8 TaxID=3228714 RepID=UPI0038C674C5